METLLNKIKAITDKTSGLALKKDETIKVIRNKTNHSDIIVDFKAAFFSGKKSEDYEEVEITYSEKKDMGMLIFGHLNQPSKEEYAVIEKLHRIVDELTHKVKSPFKIELDKINSLINNIKRGASNRITLAEAEDEKAKIYLKYNEKPSNKGKKSKVIAEEVIKANNEYLEGKQ